MDRESRMRRGGIVALAIVAAIAIGATAYQAGVSHGIALQPPVASAPGAPGGGQAVPPPAPYPYYPYRYYGPWHFGFFGPLFTILLFVFLFRMLAWGFFGWGWRRRYWHYDPELGQSRFDEWHRRAHERMRDGGPTASPQT
jgi:hypothetical protein